MYVPNYIPAPIEVPGNLTQESYRARLGFVRRVAVLHFLSLIMIGGLSTIALPTLPFPVLAVSIGAVLLMLSMVRISMRATRMDQIFSLCLFPILVTLLATAFRTLDRSGWPVWGILVGAACSVLYALCCGRDFSFVGQFLMSVIASCVALAVVAISIGMDTHRAAFLLGANSSYLFYLVYDSASLLARRRLGEEAAAVIDLYRDVFNVFGYLVRVARHWRKHKIWAR